MLVYKQCHGKVRDALIHSLFPYSLLLSTAAADLSTLHCLGENEREGKRKHTGHYQGDKNRERKRESASVGATVDSNWVSNLFLTRYNYGAECSVDAAAVAASGGAGGDGGELVRRRVELLDRLLVNRASLQCCRTVVPAPKHTTLKH